MANDWSREEVEAAVADYFDMLKKELTKTPYNKAEHNRHLQRILGKRSKGSIEFKHQNISAVLIKLGAPYIPGYVPLYNYQELLGAVVEDRWARAKSLQNLVEEVVQKPAKPPTNVRDILSALVPPPKPRDTKKALRNISQSNRKLPQRNYLEIESQNRFLGEAGEKFVLEFEERRLWRGGKKKLADKIEHVAKTKGDYLGFDILSFELNGRERLIEVKTTRFGEWTPFFASRNEVKVSDLRSDEYQLYRVFDFNHQPKLFTLGGSLKRSCELEPVQFSALPKSV